LFDRAFVLDPFYDTGALLYAAWHDPVIKDEHARRLADHAGLLVRAAPLLEAGTAVLAPDHLPGSWNPRPDWRKPRPTDGDAQLAGWWMRTALVLLYWADRLDAVVCTTRAEVVAALDVVLGVRAADPHPTDAAQATRVAHVLRQLAESTSTTAWRLTPGDASVPEPAMLIRRVLNGQDPDRMPRLPRKELRRPPLCLLPASARALRGATGVLDDAHVVDRDRAGRDHVADTG
jgi:hypothetical protein